MPVRVAAKAGSFNLALLQFARLVANEVGRLQVSAEVEVEQEKWRVLLFAAVRFQFVVEHLVITQVVHDDASSRHGSFFWVRRVLVEDHRGTFVFAGNS